MAHKDPALHIRRDMAISISHRSLQHLHSMAMPQILRRTNKKKTKTLCQITEEEKKAKRSGSRCGRRILRKPRQSDTAHHKGCIITEEGGRSTMS